MSNTLYRQLRKGSQYNDLILPPPNETEYFGRGNTDYSVSKISFWAKKHAHQFNKLSQAIKKEASTNTLEEICFCIHQFLYWHFQYEADGNAQLLRSPSHAWKNRQKGMDCKSYSVLASAILLQLGIKHFIRKIKQPNLNPESYSHVYVIVPTDQKNGTLQQGYLVIDGTIPTTNEPIFTQKKDFYMDKLPHFGLNGSETTETNDNSVSGFDWGGILNSIGLGSLTCIGGSFDDNTFKAHAGEITAFYNSEILKLNKFAKVSDFASLEKTVNRILQQAYMHWYYSLKAVQYPWKSQCSKKSAESFHKISTYYLQSFQKTLKDGWLKQHYNFNVTSPTFSTDNHFTKNYYPNITFVHPAQAHQVSGIALKIGVDKISVYEVTPYMIASSATNSLDISKYLSGLKKVLVAYNGTDTTSEEVYDNQNPTQTYNNTSKSEAGLGTLFLVAGTIGAIAYGVKHFKNKK